MDCDTIQECGIKIDGDNVHQEENKFDIKSNNITFEDIIIIIDTTKDSYTKIDVHIEDNDLPT